jgi:hypothetical protein
MILWACDDCKLCGRKRSWLILRLRFHLCNYACVGATVCKRRGMRKMGAQGVDAGNACLPLSDREIRACICLFPAAGACSRLIVWPSSCVLACLKLRSCTCGNAAICFEELRTNRFNIPTSGFIFETRGLTLVLGHKFGKEEEKERRIWGSRRGRSWRK